MTLLAPATTPPTRPALPVRERMRTLILPGLLLVGLAAAVLIRSALGGAGVARSTPAALVFAGLLVGLSVLASPPRRTGLSGRRRAAPSRVAAVALGMAGAVVLCVPAVLSSAPLSGSSDGWPSALRPLDGFLGWAVVVTVVASAEEVLLRGVLFRLLEPCGVLVAVGVPAVAFAALHLPLYGWGAMPLDLAVGVWLGALRAISGSVLAPAVAHTVADWAAYWLM